jgi:L-lactate utilization protein LutB
MLSMQEIRILGQICDTTFGKYSTGVSPTVSVTTSLQGDKLVLKYLTVVHLASSQNIRQQVQGVEEESVKYLKEYLKNTKSEFKKMSGRALKAKEIDSSDSVEMITASVFSPRKTAYYRRYVTLEVS